MIKFTGVDLEKMWAESTSGPFNPLLGTPCLGTGVTRVAHSFHVWSFLFFCLPWLPLPLRPAAPDALALHCDTHRGPSTMTQWLMFLPFPGSRLSGHWALKVCSL